MSSMLTVHCIRHVYCCSSGRTGTALLVTCTIPPLYTVQSCWLSPLDVADVWNWNCISLFLSTCVYNSDYRASERCCWSVWWLLVVGWLFDGVDLRHSVLAGNCHSCQHRTAEKCSASSTSPVSIVREWTITDGNKSCNPVWSILKFRQCTW